MRRSAALLLGLLALPASAATERFYGYAFDLKTDRHLYTEVHEQRIDDGRWTGGSIRYYWPDGRLLGVKSLDFSADPYIPTYRLDLPEQGYTEAITAVGDKIRLERRGQAGARLESASVKHEGAMCADSGFHGLIVSSFDALLAGQPLNFRLVVAGSLDAFRFRARRIGDTRFEDRPAVRFLVEPDSFLRLLVDPLEMVYDPQRRRLLEYRGVSNIRDPATGQLFVTRIAYYSEPPKVVAVLPPLEPTCPEATLSC
ncbi:hypothetical protein AAG565_04100 [Fontimonas sp. SYSU GA230001]|uniref:hypothetical protein n=1 Tax=Fontimonas sp. SYSU GA230001 TaxID=3142450 RepID=UPI0032B4D468